jgi:hypothetical protein
MKIKQLPALLEAVFTGLSFPRRRESIKISFYSCFWMTPEWFLFP